MIETSVASLICEKIGIDFQTGAPRVLTRVVRKRMEETGILDDSAYLAYAASHDEELWHLIEALVVPETWFFRDGEPFVYLRKIISSEIRFMGRSHLRILSLPASTGEEPYSIAMTLLDAGLRPADFHVDAVDISRKALDKALRGVYGPSSFREKDFEFCWRYFERSGSEHTVTSLVRSAVRFCQGNVLEWARSCPEGTYDIIFFRNLLVYLNEKAREEAVQAIDQLLGEGGMLFLGFAEPHHIFFPRFIPATHPRSFAASKPSVHASAIAVQKGDRPPFRNGRIGSPKRLPKPEPVKTDRLPPIALKPAASRQTGLTGPAVLQEPGGKPEGTEEERATLDRARELADRGMLAEAGRVCFECIKADAANSEAYYLLGVIALAGNDEQQALEHFNKVVYLEPDHADALVHLSLLTEKMGLDGQAERYRQRLARLSGNSHA